jgi:hypothetical protein
MTRTFARTRQAAAGGVVGLLLAAAPAAARGASSSDLAREVAALMTQRQVDSFAAQHPEAPNRFIATLLIPDVQMLVVSADYPAPADLQALLASKNHRDVYAALHQPATADSRFFLIDLACDGLRRGGNAIDVLYERGKTQTLFNDDWKPQGLSEAAYKTRAAEAEARYARLLTVLRDALRAPPASASQ